MDCDGPKHALIVDSDGGFVGSYPEKGSVAPFAELRYDVIMMSLFINGRYLLKMCCFVPGLVTIATVSRSRGWQTQALESEPRQNRSWTIGPRALLGDDTLTSEPLQTAALSLNSVQICTSDMYIHVV